ncbi:carbohydrate sulfotransferase 1-like [Mya arenaria]|uniref:carbohydrate sulfotransferase 1-like n=1 Tax=Mya arenaria TaxID=6604 RepID=UPI0022E573D6|nr:carbohydrate sulfotransferase 1-like [Mya arenaria]
MRTGSSLTGEILQQLPGAFYVFEPLRTLYETNSRLPGKYKVADVHVETLRGWLTCDFSRIYLKSFDDFTFLALGKQTKHLNECRRRRPVGMAPKDVFLQCVEDLRQRCLNSSVRVVKTIRTPMSMALKLSKVVDNLKVIHLVRDPRSVAVSKRIACGALDLLSCADQYCQQVTQDSKIKLDFPKNSLLDVKYEDIASRPLTTVRRMFSFLGRTLPVAVAEFAVAVTVGGNRSECEVCRQVWQIGDRSDSSLDHIDSWKRVIRPAFVSKLQHVCNHMMDMHGYRIIQYPNNASSVT